MKEWTLYLKKPNNSKKEYLGIVIAESPQKAIELYFEPESINIEPGTSIEISEEGNSRNVYEFRDGRLRKISMLNTKKEERKFLMFC